MAQKNSKKERILSALGSFLRFMGKTLYVLSIGCGLVVFCLFCLPILWVFDVLFVLTSVVWFIPLVLKNPKKASKIINVRAEANGNNDFDIVCECISLPFQNWCNTVVMCKLWTPLVNHLPIKYREWFILLGKEPLENYPKEVQMAYWKQVGSFEKELLFKKGIEYGGHIHRLSDEVALSLWKEEPEARKPWVMSGRDFCKEQFYDLLKDAPDWFKSYLLEHTPNNTVWGWIIEAAEKWNYAEEILLTLVNQAIPKPEILYQIFATETTVSSAVAEIIDKKADCRTTSIIGVAHRIMDVPASVEEADLLKMKENAGKKEVLRWENFCQAKAEIDVKAQIKMNAWQYFIFAETHHLDVPALQRQLFALKYRSWVKKMMEQEWDNIETPLVLPLIMADNDLYNTYLELKVEKK